MLVKSKFCLCLAVLLLTLWGGAMAQSVRSKSIVTIAGESYYVHTVQPGETLYSLAKLYGVDPQQIQNTNPQVAEGLQPNQILKIKTVIADAPDKNMSSRKLAKLFDEHIVNRGETAYSICKRYGLSLNTLIEDNLGLDPTALALGQKLNIRKNSVGYSEPQAIQSQLENYRDAANSVATDYKLHLVVKGETLYSLSKLYQVSQDEIKAANALNEGLKAGMMVKIPAQKRVETVTEKAEEPDFHTVLDLPKPGVTLKSSAKGETVNVAMLLPLQVGTTTNRSFLEFYQGALIALEDLKSQGVNAVLNLYNTNRSVQHVDGIVGSKEFEDTDLIIGPIYEECFEPVIAFAEKHGVAVVSPLATMDKLHSDVLYQLSPDPATKYDKLKSSLTSDKNVVLISMAVNDKEFEKEITPFLPTGYKHFTYSKNSPVTSLDALISGDKENIFVVLASSEASVDEFLARISSVQNNMLARGASAQPIKIIGTPRWLRFQNIDKNLYFKLGLSFVTSYHADRSHRVVMNFDRRYISAFAALPSLYAYRGFDAVKLFVGNIAGGVGGNLTSAVNDSTIELLQMPYRFKSSTHKENNVNKEWGLVNYNNDYTIKVW